MFRAIAKAHNASAGINLGRKLERGVKGLSDNAHLNQEGLELAEKRGCV